MTFEEKVARLRQVHGGRVEVTDYFPSDDSRRPYRFAQVVVPCGVNDYADRARELAILALEVGGCMSLFTQYRPVQIYVSLSRDLTEDELIGAPCASREVSE